MKHSRLLLLLLRSPRYFTGYCLSDACDTVVETLEPGDCLDLAAAIMRDEVIAYPEMPQGAVDVALCQRGTFLDIMRALIDEHLYQQMKSEPEIMADTARRDAFGELRHRAYHQITRRYVWH